MKIFADALPEHNTLPRSYREAKAYLKELGLGLATDGFNPFGMFDLKATVLWCTYDYPACSTMSGRTTKGYSACLHCDKDPPSKFIKNKLCYIGHHGLFPTR